MSSLGRRRRHACTMLLVLAGCAPGSAAGTGVSWDTETPPSTGSNQGGAQGAGDGSSDDSANDGETGDGASTDTPSGDGSSDTPSDGTPGTDPGAADAGTEPPVDEPPPVVDTTFDGPEVCSTNSFWTGGNEESPNMRPGYACNDCHRREGEGPIYTIAGTLYQTGHEPDDCNGVNGGGPVIQITDSAGQVVSLTPNRAGNFFTRTRFSFPVTATVLFEGRERPMFGEISAADGDCNLCHTSEGIEDAPGRIALP